MPRAPPLTAAELEQHPEYKHVIWDLKPTQRGKAPVAQGRGGAINISYEIHGHGPKLLVWIMGLGGLKSQWQVQTLEFGHRQADKYSCLILDNRGVGASDKPLARYSTSEMARDVIEVCNHVGWTAPRSLNIIGISMGGMIAQELAILIPTRISSLSLISTAARIVNTIGYLENLRNRIALFWPKPLDAQLIQAKHMLYTSTYLASPDKLPHTTSAFPTAGDRIAAIEMRKRRDASSFSRAGFMSQAMAAGWHWKGPEQLRGLADVVGRRRILVVHGTEDRMITVPHGRTLVAELNAGGKEGEGDVVRSEIFEGLGHVVPVERREEFVRLIEEMAETGRTLGDA